MFNYENTRNMSSEFARMRIRRCNISGRNGHFINRKATENDRSILLCGREYRMKEWIHRLVAAGCAAALMLLAGCGAPVPEPVTPEGYGTGPSEATQSESPAPESEAGEEHPVTEPPPTASFPRTGVKAISAGCRRWTRSVRRTGRDTKRSPCGCSRSSTENRRR